MKKRKSSGEGGSNWMDTYGDMVTLLLCFFVLLYSISSVDQQKWEIIVKSFNPGADAVSQIVTDSDLKEGDDDVSGHMEQPEMVDDFEDLMYSLQELIQEGKLSDNVSVEGGEGFAFITFRDMVFFDGDSSVLKDEGKPVLEAFGQAMSSVSDSIEQVQVLGHTSQASPNIPNEAHTDRLLSAERSAEVVAYLQQVSNIDPAKMVSSGFGQFRPIATFDTPEGRAQNRRVEILITRTGAVEQNLDAYYDQVYGQ